MIISTHAPAGGATKAVCHRHVGAVISTHAPAGGATYTNGLLSEENNTNFYSRPCGRGDQLWRQLGPRLRHFYSRPCGRGDVGQPCVGHMNDDFLLTPLREGRRDNANKMGSDMTLTFYSRPCGRGDLRRLYCASSHAAFLLTPLREGRQRRACRTGTRNSLSTHAPAGGATYQRQR